MSLSSEKGHHNDSTSLIGKNTLNRLEHAPTEGSDSYHKIDKAAKETPVSASVGMIDDFRLWGSRRCRRRGRWSSFQRSLVALVNLDVDLVDYH